MKLPEPYHVQTGRSEESARKCARTRPQKVVLHAIYIHNLLRIKFHAVYRDRLHYSAADQVVRRQRVSQSVAVVGTTYLHYTYNAVRNPP